jgi:hypothetical protein
MFKRNALNFLIYGWSVWKTRITKMILQEIPSDQCARERWKRFVHICLFLTSQTTATKLIQRREGGEQRWS